MSGHPGSTSRGLTIAELEYLRDVSLPKTQVLLAEMRGMVTEFQKRGPEQKRISNNLLFGVENALKSSKGQHEALLDKKFFAQKVAAERSFARRSTPTPR